MLIEIRLAAGVTRPEQELFLSYLKNTPSASLWYPIFAVLVGTGLRVGEATGLRWCDIDLDEGIINVNHTLVYYDHRTDGSKRGCYFSSPTSCTFSTKDVLYIQEAPNSPSSLKKRAMTGLKNK